MREWLCSKDNTRMAQVIISLSLGILMSPISNGLFYLLLFIIIYEIVLWIVCPYDRTNGSPWELLTRAAVIMASILGFIIGRLVCNLNILHTGTPDKVLNVVRDMTKHKE